MVKDMTDLDRLLELYLKDSWTDEEELEVNSLKAKIESWESLFTTLTNENKELIEERVNQSITINEWRDEIKQLTNENKKLELERDLIYKDMTDFIKQLEQLKNLVSEIEKLVDKHELVAGIKIEQILQKHKQSGWLFEPKLGELKRQ